MAKITVKQKNVNSKVLYNEINNHIITEVKTSTLRWNDQGHRDAVIDFVLAILEEQAADGRITQFNAFCKEEQVSVGSVKTFLIVKYRQKHCLNITEITYFIYN